MIVTKLKRGWRLRLSESEMEVLSLAVEYLQEDMARPETAYKELSASGKAAFLRSFAFHSWLMNVEVSKRPPRFLGKKYLSNR